MQLVANWFEGLGISTAIAVALTRVIFVVLVIALSFAVNLVTKRLFARTAGRIIAASRTTWDDALLRHGVLTRLSHLAAAITFYLLMPLVFSGRPDWVAPVLAGAQIYALVMVILALGSMLDAGVDVYETFDIADRIPITGFVQVAKLLIYFAGGLVFLSIVVDKTPLILLSGLGAFAAVLMVIFHDAILGFVAGIQLTANRMVARGDWIEMPKYQADGVVIEVSLTTVKVQNWDKTITTIPTYALISESFKNWRGMSDANARRIKRAIRIDIDSIRFCTDEMLERYARIQFISEYIERKKRELLEHNARSRAEPSSLANGRRLTNIGTFRAYVHAYLENHPNIVQGMTFLVRQLEPSEVGVPIEIYVFCDDTAWVRYEAIQSDIFDHLLAVVPEFDLRVFQNPTGADIRILGAAPAV